MTTQSLTPRGAVLLGLLCVVLAAVPILGGLHLIPVKPRAGTPAWLGVAMGLMFLFAGVTLLADAAAGGIGPSGELPQNAPPAFHVVQSVMGLGIVLAMAAVFSWVGFGAGERHFSTTVSLPFGAWKPKNDTIGRWAFGTAAVLLWGAIAIAVIASVRRLIVRIRASLPV
jgi:hypothetical protein